MKNALHFVWMSILAAFLALGGLLILADVVHSLISIKPTSSHAAPVCKRVMA